MPAGGAKLRWYDPWVRYTRSRNENRGRPPYLSLASLVENLTGEARARGQDLVADAALNQVERSGFPPPLSEQALESIWLGPASTDYSVSSTRPPSTLKSRREAQVGIG